MPASSPIRKTHLGQAAASALRVPIARVSFGEEEERAIQRPLEDGWVVQGPRVDEFEEQFAGYIGAEHAAATTSCTTAMHLAVATLGLQPGDEVIVPAFTWVSTANVVEYMGATPRFCDVELSTFNVDPTKIEELITDRTVGILPVHLFGLCARMEPILAVAKEHGLWVVEDAACGFGAWQDGRHAGTFGQFGAFSFHPRKSITTGEGGMLVTSDEDRDVTVRALRDHGADRTDFSRHHEPRGFLLSDFNQLGYNYRMTDLQGALGCAQMERADWILDQRRRRAAIYDRELARFPWLATPQVPADDVHGYQSYVCLFRPDQATLADLDRVYEERNVVMERMAHRGVATRQGTHAAALTGYYSRKYGISRDQVPNAAIAERLSLALPLFPDMTDEDQELVIDELERAFENR
jgi:dTDP-4-amino-4,6-dideoxygalactose transaminase